MGITSIGTAGRDYTTIVAWEAGEQFTTPAGIKRGECYPDSVFTIGAAISGSLSDASNYMHLTVAPGHEHNGVPGSGVVIALNGLNILDVTDPYTIVEGIEIDGGGVGTAGDKGGVRLMGEGSVCRNMIIHGLHASNFYNLVDGIEGRNILGTYIYNNLVYDLKNLAAPATSVITCGIQIFNDNTYAYHNTVHDISQPSASTNQGYGITTPGQGLTGFIMQNNISMDCGRDHRFVTFQGTGSNNMDSDGSLAGTNNQLNQLSQNQFVSIPSSDYHLKAGSAAIGNGIPIPLVATDIAQNPRSLVAPSIGAFEYVPAAGPLINHFLKGY